MTHDTIAALATAQGAGAIAVIRLSGRRAIEICEVVFQSASGKPLSQQKTQTIHFGKIIDEEGVLDEVLVSIFRKPHSYTGEDLLEISCHGSAYIQQKIMELLLRKGCRPAAPGEFTMRAFLNGKLDLAQAEAVADLIASNNRAAHRVAMMQMRGGYGQELQKLRAELIHFASLMELELDFSEEDVDFADREKFQELITRMISTVKSLINSFSLGNVLKKGIPVAIVGKPNVGKSTLLNALLNEERAIVSPMAGTTRDTIEEEITLHGVGFRFIDTAGLRQTDDAIERMGIERTNEKIRQAEVIIYLFDGTTIDTHPENINAFREEARLLEAHFPDKTFLFTVNKIDECSEALMRRFSEGQFIKLSAKTQTGLDILLAKLAETIPKETETDSFVVTNARHHKELINALQALELVNVGLKTYLPADLLAIDVREASHHLGLITGEITTDDLLENIFKNFCIGK